MSTTPVPIHADQLALSAEAQDLLFRGARPPNTVTHEPVSDEQIQAIYDLTKWAPTAANTQPLRVLAIRSAEAKARLSPHMSEGNRAKTDSAPVTAILAADTKFFTHWDRLFPHMPGGGAQFDGNPEAATGMARFNAALQAGYFILGVRAAGLAAGPMAGFDAAGIDAEFFPEGDLQSIVVVNIGHPGEDAWFPRSPRLEHDEVVTVL
jgi:3-hydroxypropanoate dehydrogenase